MVSTARVTSRCLAGVMGAAMAVSAGCNRGTETNTPATDSSRPAAVATAPADRKYLLERVDDAAVVQLYADGFDELPLREKTLIWHLYQAALAGRDIFYDQRYAHNLEMRDVLEEIITHPEGVDPQTLAEIQRYTKLFWINTGPYNNLTARKFVLKCTPEAFAAAAPPPRRAARSSRSRPASRSTRCSRACSRCSSTSRSIRSSPTRRPARARTSSPSSANNLYVGVTMKDLDGLQGAVSAELAAGEAERQARRRGLPRRRQVRRADPADRRPPRGGDPVRDRADGEGAAGARQVLSDRRDGRSRRLRHRLGPGQGFAGRHDQRLHRGLHGRARHEGLVGGARLLREPGEDRRDPQARRRRAVVRGPHAVGRRSTASRASRASPPTPSTSSSKPATRRRSRRSASTCRTIRRSARSTAASRCRCRTSTRPTTGPRRPSSGGSSRGRRKRRRAPRSGAASPAS